jgi:hypothetical protein
MTFSLQQQIEEVQRELALRERVYPGLVRKRQMRQPEADYHMARMRAVLETLRGLEAGSPAAALARTWG